jgi:NAD(P) transhydrogenase subunit alpha
MTIGVLVETGRNETRTALVPGDVGVLAKAGSTVLVERGAGYAAGYPDSAYEAAGARIEARETVLHEAEVLLAVRAGAAAGDEGLSVAKELRDGAIVIGLLDPWDVHASFDLFRKKRCTLYALELLPRITRAQSMDVLSSQANLAGYKAVVLAASLSSKIFPMLMTAAGTLVPVRLFVIGAGVAGLQAIATGRRLGAVVSAYDVREAAAEQVESLGAKFLRMPLPTDSAEGAGGYAKAMDEAFYRKQRELMHDAVVKSDVVVTIAAIPGKPSPRLITAEMVEGMQPGSVIVDLAAERGGNCELSEPGETIVRHGVTIAAPLSLGATMPHHASQLYSRNVTNFLLSLMNLGRFEPSPDDEVAAATCIMRDGEPLRDLTAPRT